MADEDWKKLTDDAADAAKRKANAATDDELNKILDQAGQLQEIFDALKLRDKATYDQLIKIVEGATQRNESIAAVIDRVKNLGAAGMKLAETVENISSGVSLAVLRQALNLSPR